MDLFEAIGRRHSYRGPFQDQQIPRSDLKRIVQAGLQAPSGKNAQTTVFVIVDDSDLVRTIAGMPGANTAQQQAHAYIACIVDVQPEAVYEGHDFQIEDCAAAVENMLLAVTALGYASVWVDGWLRVRNRAGEVGRMLGLPQGKIIRVLLPIGAPKEARAPAEKKPFESRAWFNRYRGAGP
jgi:nitroreductase